MDGDAVVLRITPRLAIPDSLGNPPAVMLSTAVTNRLSPAEARQLASELLESADAIDPPAPIPWSDPDSDPIDDLCSWASEARHPSDGDIEYWLCDAGHEIAVSGLAMRVAIPEPRCPAQVIGPQATTRCCNARLVTKVRTEHRGG